MSPVAALRHSLLDYSYIMPALQHLGLYDPETLDRVDHPDLDSAGEPTMVVMVDKFFHWEAEKTSLYSESGKC